MFKDSLVGILPREIKALLDRGYQGAEKYLPNALIPFKSSKNRDLTKEEKRFNSVLSKLRSAIERVNRELKIFRICKETYRGKGKRGLIRVGIIASLLNFLRNV